MRCVIILWEHFENQTLGKGLGLLADALYEKNDTKLSTAAKLLAQMCDRGYVSKHSEPIVRAISAFGFEASGETPQSKRSYRRLSDNALPLENTLGSAELAKTFTEAIKYYGLRDFDGFKILAESIFEELKRLEKSGIRPNITMKPDYIVSLGMIDLLLTYHEALQRERKLSVLASKIESLSETVKTIPTSAWLSILARLVCHTLSSNVRRSILGLNLPQNVESKLLNRRITELWTPQAEAIEKGLLIGKNIVYSTEVATGKSLLAYLVASRASIPQKVIYIVPTRTLADEAFRTLKDIVHSSRAPVAISTRERAKQDDELNQFAVIVATYEKFDALLRRKKIDEANIYCLIADEVHFISSMGRGIPLEFTLTRMKSKTDVDPQIIALSGMINKKDAVQLSSWLEASLVHSDWKPVDLDEMIFYDGRLYHKEGNIEQIPVKPLTTLPKLRQRIAATSRLVRDTIVKDGQCMVIVRSRKDAEEIAEHISKYLGSTQFFDPDLRALLGPDTKGQISIDKAERERLIREIQNSEPELPICAKKLSGFLSNGVAYHHAGLPPKYREIVERAIRKRLAKVLVATTTFEVGVNLPVTRVIFLNIGNMKVRTYRNLAGRAGRPQFDIKGESVIIALTEIELQRLRNKYFFSENEPLESSVQNFMKRRPSPRYAIQSQILGAALGRDTMNFASLMNFLKQSWFWTRADDQDKEKFKKYIDIELWNLSSNYGLIVLGEDKEEIKITSTGKVASEIMLSPFSTVNLIDNARRIFAGKYDEESLVILLLSLVGIPDEMRENDSTIKRVKVPRKFHIISRILEQNPAFSEPKERIELCPQYGTILWYWINSVPTEDILKKCNLDPSADAALLEETLPNDAYWVLTTLALIPGSVSKITREQRDLVVKLAIDCKFGSSDPITHELLSLGLKHIGRNTAIKLAKYMRQKKKSINQLTESDFLQLFPENQESAKLLFTELEEKKS